MAVLSTRIHSQVRKQLQKKFFIEVRKLFPPGYLDGAKYAR